MRKKELNRDSLFMALSLCLISLGLILLPGLILNMLTEKLAHIATQ
jgi:hypothetical protein